MGTDQFTNTIVGAVKINKSFEYIKNDFECAAWCETYEAKLGVFPIYFRTDLFDTNKSLYVVAEIGATVIDDYFPALWGGAPISNKKYVPKHVGEPRVIHIEKSCAEAIELTGNTPDEAISWYIDPAFWSVALNDSKRLLDHYANGYQKAWDRYKNGEDEYDSHVGMVEFIGNKIGQHASNIRIISWHMRNHGLISPDKVFKCNFEENTKWAKNFLSQLKAA